MTVNANPTTPSAEHVEISLTAAAHKGRRPSKVRTALDKTSVRICGTDYQLNFVFRLLERFNVYGQTDLFNNTILIDSNLTEAEALSTVLHEILEVVNRKYVLGLDHDTLQKIEVMLFAVFSDNPNLMKVFADFTKRTAVGFKRGK